MQIPMPEVATESSLNISAKTAGRVLRASGRRVRWARHKPFISAVNRRKRVSWARGQRHTTISQWEKRIFTDEIHVELSPRGLFPSCFTCQELLLTALGQRPRVRHSEYDERFIAPAFKSARTSVMFWGAVGYGYHSPLVAIRKRTVDEKTSDKELINTSVNRWLGNREPEVQPGVLASQWYNEMKAMPFGDQSTDNRSQARKEFCSRITQRAEALYLEIIKDTSWREKVIEEVCI